MKARLTLAVASIALAQTPTITSTNPVVQQGGTVALTSPDAVTWKLKPGSVGTINATTGVYTPPAVPARAHQTIGGCQGFPASAIWNVRTDGLPLHPMNATWKAKLVSGAPYVTKPYVTYSQNMPLNVVDSATVPQVSHIFGYTPAMNGAFWNPPLPLRRHQQGDYTDSRYMDRHMMSVDQNCNMQELYHECTSAEDPFCTTERPGATAASGAKYDLKTFRAITGGGTDAAGLPVYPTTLKVQDILAGDIRQIVRTTFGNSKLASKYIWPATAHAYPCHLWAVQNTPECESRIPYGAIFRLNAAAYEKLIAAIDGVADTTCPAGCKVLYKRLARQLKEYGVINSDGTAEYLDWDTAIDNTFRTTPDLDKAFAMFRYDGLKARAEDMEAVDASVIKVSDSSYAVRPHASYAPNVDNYAEAEACRTDDPTSCASVMIAIQPATVGVRWRDLTMAPGATAQIDAWVRGVANTAKTYTIQTPVTGLSVSASGLITAPSSATVPVRTVIRVASAADPGAYTDVSVTIVPLDNGVLRVAPGWAPPYAFSDANGTVHLDRFVSASGKTFWGKVNYNGASHWIAGENGTNYGGNGLGLWPNVMLYQEQYQGALDAIARFYVQKGRYKVIFRTASNIAPTPARQWHMDLNGVLVHKNVLNACNGSNVPCDKSAEVDVTDGSLFTAVRGFTTAPGIEYYPSVSAIEIEPVATPTTPAPTPTKPKKAKWWLMISIDPETGQTKIESVSPK